MLSAQVLEPRDTNLFYYWWYEDLISDSAQKVYFSETDEGYMCQATYGGNSWFPWGSTYYCAEAAQYLFTDSALSILGLRVCNMTMDDDWLEQADVNCADNMNVCAYEKWRDSMYLLGKKHLYHDNQFHAHSSMNFIFRGHPPYVDSCYYDTFQGGVPYREYYFDSPITVTDSFFISVSFGGDKYSSTIGYLNLCSERLADTCFLGVDNFPAFRYRFKTGTYDPYTLDFTIHDGWKDTTS